MAATENEIRISSVAGSAPIPGVVMMPRGGSRLVIFSHGIQGNRDEYLDTQRRLAYMLYENGVGSLRIDYRGHGNSAASLEEYCIRTQTDDLRRSIDWSIKEFGLSNVALAGISFGAPATLICAARRPSYISKLVLVAPVLDMRTTFIEPITSWGISKFGLDRIRQALATGDGIKIDDGYTLGIDVVSEMCEFDIPFFVSALVDKQIVIFHGSDDDMVPLSSSEAVADANNNISLVIMPHTEHGLTEVGDDNYTSKRSMSNATAIVSALLEEGWS
ncbi:alpha/beta hydrolase family protein [Actinomyces oricola]|uniref:alpha/beta hydrolase family protein n=1 Tax=Actinomyces oricola TaxID=206043 RepID=UPI0013E8D682|nr:alpha/beta fold hydrolase [Actinomyces oricola]